jgi:hypothetical protein
MIQYVSEKPSWAPAPAVRAWLESALHEPPVMYGDSPPDPHPDPHLRWRKETAAWYALVVAEGGAQIRYDDGSRHAVGAGFVAAWYHVGDHPRRRGWVHASRAHEDGTLTEWIEKDIGDGWRAVYYFNNGAITEVRIVPTSASRYALGQRRIAATPTHPLSAAMCRDVLPGTAMQVFMRKLDQTPPPALTAHYGDGRVPERPRRPGRRGRGDRYFAEYARDYVDALGRSPASPVAFVADVRGESRDYVAQTIMRCRDKGMLEPRRSGRGRAQGWLTPRAERLLAAEPG